jgi:hypothetical protein
MARALPSYGIASLFAIMLLAGCSRKADPGALQQRLIAQVPLRSTPAQVLAFLNGQKISHSPYRQMGNSGYAIEAEMSVPARGNLVQPSYDVVFQFDDHGLLKSCEVQYLGFVGL